MTKEELILMVQSIAGVHFDREGMVSLHARDIRGIVNVGMKVGAAAEREACAKVCDDLPVPPYVSDNDAHIWDVTCVDCAEAIRARGQQ